MGDRLRVPHNTVRLVELSEAPDHVTYDTCHSNVCREEPSVPAFFARRTWLWIRMIIAMLAYLVGTDYFTGRYTAIQKG